MFKSQKSIMAAAMASVAMMGSRVFGASAISHVVTQNQKSGKRLVNRSRYTPHQGEREIARRLRQAARDEQRQRERSDNHFGAVAMNVERLSRRGRPVAA